MLNINRPSGASSSAQDYVAIVESATNTVVADKQAWQTCWPRRCETGFMFARNMIPPPGEYELAYYNEGCAESIARSQLIVE